MTIERVYKDYVAQLKSIYEESEALTISDWIFESVTGLKRIDRVANKQNELDDSIIEQFNNNLKELLQHKPVQYVLKEAWFYKLKFFVNEDVLIPRPETEELVEWVLSGIKNKNEHLKLIEIGTGSGCIAIALKKQLPSADIVAVDVSTKALSVARKNADDLGAEIHFLPLNFLDEKEWDQLSAFDVIVSNPPYIPEKDRGTLAKNVVDYEPALALFVSNTEPFIFYKKIALFAQLHLNIEGKIYVEVHEQFSGEVKEIFTKHRLIAKIKKDIYGRNRMISAHR